MKKTPLSLCLSTFLIGMPASAATLLHAGKVITAETDKVLTEHTIVIEQDKITALESGYRQPGVGLV